MVVSGPARVDCVCTSLRMAGRTMARVYDEALRPAGLRTGQFSILSRLGSDGRLAISQLAERLAMDRTTLAREVEPLVAGGLVARTTGEDRRQRLLELTETGRARLRRAWPLWEQVQGDVRGAFGVPRTDGLVRDLHDLVGLPRGRPPA